MNPPPATPGTAADGATTVPQARPARVRQPFIDELSTAHYARLARGIILSGNVDDLFPVDDEEGSSFVGLSRLLARVLRHARYPLTGATAEFLVITLRSDGIAFASAADRQTFANAPARVERDDPDLAAELRTFLRESLRERSSSLVTVTLLGELLRLATRLRARGVPVRPIALVIDHAETLLPAGDISRLAPLDREAVKVVVDLLRADDIWAEAETADAFPDVVILVVPAAAEMSDRINGLPKTARINVPLPSADLRSAFITSRVEQLGGEIPGLGADYPTEDLVRDSTGLTLRAIDDLLIAATRDPEESRLGRSEVVTVVNGIIAARLGSIVRVVYPDHGMDAVVGFTALKARLARLRQRFDDVTRAPAGITVVGPNGAGKTFMIEAFAKDSERTVITLSEIRSEWYGKTDVFAERFATELSAFGRILVLVDEAHVAFGSIHSRNTHETEARLTRHIIQLIDDLANRGRVVWALITTRPDLLDPDLVRSGRCSLFVPIFDPEGADQVAFAEFAARRIERSGIVLNAAERTLLAERTRGFSAGDFRELADDLADERLFNPSVEVARYLETWTPSAVGLARPRELQILLAALNCDWPELLPERFRGRPKDEIQADIDRLRLSLV